MQQNSFSSLGLKPALLANLESVGYSEMTPIQARSLPPVLEGRDVIGQGKTGSGKTAAFGLGLLNRLDSKSFRVQSLVLCPTRELADQVAREIRKLARSVHNVKVMTLCGGTPIGPQVGSLQHGAHIIVGTPGRVEDHLRKGTLTLENLSTLVLDEADRMLDMGFQTALDAIIEYLPDRRQTLLFSATYPDGIRAIAGRVMVDPVMAQVDVSHDDGLIGQYFYPVDDCPDRTTALRLLLLHFRPGSALVFCTTRQETAEVARALRQQGFSALPLHGDLDQKTRDQTLVRFANRSVSILVATDVAARGLDIDNLDAVFNYHIPRDSAVYTHRIGRTGRAGSKGLACTLFSDRERHKAARLEGCPDLAAASQDLPAMALLNSPTYRPPMVTLQVDGGKKQKLRPGDILGALTSDQGVSADEVGKIDVCDNWTYVAVKSPVVNTALHKLGAGRLKGRSFRVRKIG